MENPDLRHIESPQYHLQVTDCSGNNTGETEEIEEDIDELIDIEQDEQECTNKNNKTEDPVDHRISRLQKDTGIGFMIWFNTK